MYVSLKVIKTVEIFTEEFAAFTDGDVHVEVVPKIEGCFADFNVQFFILVTQVAHYSRLIRIFCPASCFLYQSGFTLVSLQQMFNGFNLYM